MRSLLTWLASPLGVFFCGIVLGGAMVSLSSPKARRFRRAGIALCVVVALQLVAFSWGPLAYLLARPLEERARIMAAQAPRDGYAAILLLGGIVSLPAAGYGQYIDFGSNASRIWAAARLYHAGVAPQIIVSGGSFPRADGKMPVSEAESIRPVLQELGVPFDAILLEPRSLNTRENAQESRHLIEDQAKVALVTSAFHMPRAMREM
ncbi:MAG: YdcF family protein, partial [Pyrinomonadaceae bacterium]